MHLPPHRAGCIPDVYWDAPLGTSQRGVFVVSQVRGGVQQVAWWLPTYSPLKQ